MSILSLLNMVHKLLHSLPVLLYNASVAKLLPRSPRHDNACISPTEAHIRVTERSYRSHARETAILVLSITHIAHPLEEEIVRIGKERTRLGKHLSIGSPTKALIALWTVGRHREIVRKLSPIGVCNKFIDKLVTSGNFTNLQFLFDRCHRDRLHALKFDCTRSCNIEVAVAEKRIARIICNKVSVVTEGVNCTNTILLTSYIAVVAASLGTINQTILSTITIVENLSRKACQNSTLYGLELE